MFFFANFVKYTVPKVSITSGKIPTKILMMKNFAVRLFPKTRLMT